MSRKDRKRFRALAVESEPIAGIYSYCDRWCERCGFTSRCLQFRLEKARSRQAATGPPRARHAPSDVTDSIRMAADLLAEMADAASELPPDLDVDAIGEEYVVHPIESLEVQECVQGAMEYAATVDHWFQASPAPIREKVAALKWAVKAGLPGADPVTEAQAIEEALQVIRWDQHLVFFKISRAITGVPEEDDPTGAPVPENDADGSAKVALVSMDRSIEAWRRLADALPDARDEILDLIVLLDELRRRTESLFPGARAFVRPGFDTGGEASPASVR